MRKDYSLKIGRIQIDDDRDSVSITIDKERYVAKTYPGAGRLYHITKMDDISHNNIDISEKTNCFPAGKRYAIDFILCYAGLPTYQTLVKRAKEVA
ncbi:hypothetical protein bpr_II129 (plasmid) [Butyrivibrio proteoclasticus B316]|uniref:Uncharacterized protein n=1 Tax=Butyrivibrio proteoclasticus (strain ATCC 51982 / DSM 14932 / B316) TaxID=515622 RepID=E0S3T6_BUTPB|nr:hypothetical protein [Butyrivibrio proteoclasticus]ADL36068.1 hypothetical protein bpr_II129 [Butyrivibrio proteoclasticus B316]